jgi:phosphoglycolate phosphatase-like HAD superfamily hydrolase
VARTNLAFDLDGTLIDARRRQVGVAREALLWATGEKLDELSFWRAKRSGATTLEALLGLGYAAADAERVTRRWAELIETDEWLASDRALTGARRALAGLRAHGAVVTVITARRRSEGARCSVQASGIASLIHELIVVESDLAVSAKAQALRRCGADGFIGDTDSDGKAARAAVVRFVAVMTGQRSRAYLHARGYQVARSLSEALELLPSRPTSFSGPTSR